MYIRYCSRHDANKCSSFISYRDVSMRSMVGKVQYKETKNRIVKNSILYFGTCKYNFFFRLFCLRLFYWNILYIMHLHLTYMRKKYGEKNYIQMYFVDVCVCASVFCVQLLYLYYRICFCWQWIILHKRWHIKKHTQQTKKSRI